MKKFSFSLSMTLLVATVATIFMACQKEQTPVADNTSATAESNTIVGVNGASISGLITNGNADALRAAYIKTVGANETQYIQFSIADLEAYIKAMKAKYNSDQIYVNFGVYNATTVPDGNKDYIGRKTVFFTVNNKKKSGGNIVTNDDTDPGDNNSLNHGTIFP